MKLKYTILIFVASLLIGCDGSEHDHNSKAPVIAEGVIWYVEYELGEGKTTGFTRSQHAVVIPSGGGGLKVDAYGKLTSQFLIITYPNRKDLSQHVIPVDRLLSIQFGDGGVETADQ